MDTACDFITFTAPSPPTDLVYVATKPAAQATITPFSYEVKDKDANVLTCNDVVYTASTLTLADNSPLPNFITYTPNPITDLEAPIVINVFTNSELHVGVYNLKLSADLSSKRQDATVTFTITVEPPPPNTAPYFKEPFIPETDVVIAGESLVFPLPRIIDDQGDKVTI